MFEAYFFDLDGTLVETAPEIADAVNDTLRYFDWPVVTQQQVNDWIGHGTKELLIMALASVTQSSVEAVRVSDDLKQALPIFDRYYQERCGTRSHLYPHVKEVLTRLRQQGSKLAVVTNKEGRYTDIVLRVHELTDLFDIVISGDSFPVKKPNPTSVQNCLARWNVLPQQALFVGDSSIDAQTARNANVPVWLLPYGYNMGQTVQSCQPDRVIANFSELLSSPEP
ncbi:HAD-IA family hydrolase [Limnohabitans sp. Rim11]|uniref:HAD-IA family hydrolase n=1 Tax=Limnohabitans sp. Rim11 TaxID=1100719 RepID=UPI000B0010DE|nr:HAD-IA family hydrolase [Limnohabitans sp. Rim11]